MGDLVTVRTKRVLTNPLLARKQMVVEIIHPARPCINKGTLSERLAQMYKTTPDLVVPYGLKTKFGGGKTDGFALVYDTMDLLKKFEPRHRLLRAKLIPKVERPGRKQRKEKKNRLKKLRGKEKLAAMGHAPKK